MLGKLSLDHIIITLSLKLIKGCACFGTKSSCSVLLWGITAQNIHSLQEVDIDSGSEGPGQCRMVKTCVLSIGQQGVS